MYTSHGHQIQGTIAEEPRPSHVARCGGPSICVKCGTEAMAALQPLSQSDIDAVFEKVVVPNDLLETNQEDNRSLEHSEIQNRYGYHKGTEITGPQHQMCRAKFMEMAEFLDALLPGGRAKALAMTELETASMWANKAIAEQAPIVTE